MKREKISQVINNINQKYIDEATEYKGRITPKVMWHKWVAIAACFALLIAIGLPIAKDSFVPMDDQILDAIMLIEYDDAYLEILEDKKTIAKIGLKKEITDNVIGNHIAYLEKVIPDAERSNYIVSEEETEIELFEYAPASCKAVKVFKEGNKYYYAVLCNYLLKTNEALPIQKAFETYGINNHSDIISITPTKNDNTWKVNGRIITDTAVISEFFNKLSVLPEFSFDKFHDLVFENELKEIQGTGSDISSEAYTRLAEDFKQIIIETKDGIHFRVEYYLSYGWIRTPVTMSYYQMSPEMIQWFKTNIK